MGKVRKKSSQSVMPRLGILLAYTVLASILPNRERPWAERRREASLSKEPTSKDDPIDLQHFRAKEEGRGRRANSPTEIPLKGWKDILWRTYAQIQEDRLLAISAGVVFYCLLALFPALTALVSLYGLFASSATIQEHLSFLSTFMPGAAVSVINEQVARLVSKGDVKLGFGVVLGLGIALWSANGGMKALIDALNIAYEEEEKRGFFKLNLVSLLFTGGALAAILFAISAVVALPLLLNQLGLGPVTDALAQYGRWPLLLMGLLTGLAILYRYAPSRREPKWKWVSVGGVLASVLWIAGSIGFSYYLENFGNYDATYGSLGAGIGMMMWMWLTTIVILFGAELNSEIEHQTAMDTTEGAPKPLGARGATMADTVGAAQSS
jgi:membrane protein